MISKFYKTMIMVFNRVTVCALFLTLFSPLAFAESKMAEIKSTDEAFIRHDIYEGSPSETIEIYTQQVDVTGTVTNQEGRTLPGVAVSVQGTTTGTITDLDGKYSLSAPEGATLIFSYIGYTSQTIEIGNRSVIDVVLEESTQGLEEVVVTALGIQRSARSLGYATSSVKSEELTVNRSPNMMNSLVGKVAGVNISPMGTGPGGSSKIRIRGQSSISGQNNPLIVVNGVPIDNTNFGTNPGNGASDGSIGNRGGGMTSDGGDGLASINPDDIADMTILKGAAASALYGSRAKDGVIMITTKSGAATRGIGVTYNLRSEEHTSEL